MSKHVNCEDGGSEACEERTDRHSPWSLHDLNYHDCSDMPKINPHPQNYHPCLQTTVAAVITATGAASVAAVTTANAATFVATVTTD